MKTCVENNISKYMVTYC